MRFQTLSAYTKSEIERIPVALRVLTEIIHRFEYNGLLVQNPRLDEQSTTMQLKVSIIDPDDHQPNCNHAKLIAQLCYDVGVSVEIIEFNENERTYICRICLPYAISVKEVRNGN